jgi:predicted transcriptional regulator
MLPMTTMTIEIEDEVVEQLAKVGPSRSRQQSEFVATAIRRALWELEEKDTAAAYARQPDSEDDVYVDPGAWE